MSLVDVETAAIARRSLGVDLELMVDGALCIHARRIRGDITQVSIIRKRCLRSNRHHESRLVSSLH